MGKTVTKQDLFSSTPPSLLDPRAYSPEDWREPQAVSIFPMLFPCPLSAPLADPSPSLLWLRPLLSLLTSKVPRAEAPTAAMPGRTAPPPVLCRLLVASCVPSAPDLAQQPLPEDSAGVLAQGSLSDQCWLSCRFWASDSPLSPPSTGLCRTGASASNTLTTASFPILLNPGLLNQSQGPGLRLPFLSNLQLMTASLGEETCWSKAFPNSKQIRPLAHGNSHLAQGQLLTHPL